MKIVVASDHAGFELKMQLKQFLIQLGHEVTDVGAYTTNVPADDYPFLASAAAKLVVAKESERAILVCGTGIGMAIAANKVPGARAAVCNDLFSARKSREHNDANICGLGARIIGLGLAKEIVQLWLATAFDEGKHRERVEKYNEIEREFYS